MVRIPSGAVSPISIIGGARTPFIHSYEHLAHNDTRALTYEILQSMKSWAIV